MNEIENASCVTRAMDKTPALKIEGHKQVSNNILQKFNDGVYNCTCTVGNKNNIYNTSHAFDYDSHFKQLGQKTCCDAD